MSEIKKPSEASQGVVLSSVVRAGMIKELQKQLLAHFESGIRSTVSGTEGVLLDAVGQAGDNEARSACLENIAGFRTGKQQLIDHFLHAWGDNFSSYFTGNAVDITGLVEVDEGDHPTRSAALSLIGKDAQEESLLISNMASRLNKQYGLELVVMRRRLAHLAGARYSDETLSPLCPAAMAGVLQQAAQKAELASGLKRALYLQFDQTIMHSLPGIYEHLGSYLRKHHVLPGLTVEDVLAEQAAAQRERLASTRAKEDAGKRDKKADGEAVRTPAGGGEQHNDATMAGGGSAETGGRQGGTVYQQQIEQQIDEINSLLGNYRNTLGVILPSGSRMLDSFAPPGANKNYTQEQVVRALQSMQRQRASGLMSEGEDTDAFKQGMYQTLAATTTNPKDFRVGSDESNLIDLVGMLFDFVKEEKRLKDSHKNALTHLQNLYCQVALHDASFFHNTKHPAHLLLNCMVQAGSQYQGEGEQKLLTETIEEAVKQALTEYQHDDQVFDRLLDQFSQKMATLQQRVERREQRTVDAAKGREKLIFARKHARGFVEVCIKRHQPPEMIRAFLQSAWTDVLVFYFLRTGPSSTQWQENAKIAEELSWSCTPLDEQQREQFASRKDLIMSGIQQALEQLSAYSELEIQRVIQDIQTCQKAVQAQQQQVVEQLSNTLASSMTEADEKELLPVEEVDEKTLDAKSRQLMDKLKHVRFGTWFEFSEPPHRLKLAWFSPTTQRCMFVDTAGQGSYIKNWTTLFEQLQRGEAKIVEEVEATPFFERALQAIQRTLRQFANSYVSEIRSSKPGRA